MQEPDAAQKFEIWNGVGVASQIRYSKVTPQASYLGGFLCAGFCELLEEYDGFVNFHFG